MTKTKVKDNINSVIVEALQDKKASDIVIMDFSLMRNMMFSYFIICHGASTTQVQTIAEHVSKQVKKEIKIHPKNIEGTSNLQWVLIDFGDTVVHVFLDEYRTYYSLEDVWADTQITKMN